MFDFRMGRGREDYPESELSNHLVENSMRGVALGGTIWINVGSEGAGSKVAAILNAVESCRRLGEGNWPGARPGLGQLPGRNRMIRQVGMVERLLKDREIAHLPEEYSAGRDGGPI